MGYFTSNASIADIELNAKRIDRGRYGCSGFIEAKVDIYDEDVRVELIVKRSAFRSGPYTTLPMKIDNETLPTVFNVFYKNVVMEDAQKCCENAPYFEGNYVGPLTKRRVVLNECTIDTEKLPSYMMEGYYITRTTVYAKDWYGYLETLVYVESAK